MNEKKKIRYIGIYCSLTQSHIKLVEDKEIERLKDKYELMYLPCEVIYCKDGYEVCSKCNLDSLKRLLTLANYIEEVYG